MPRSSDWPREGTTPFHLLQQELNRWLGPYIGPVRFGGPGEGPTDLHTPAWSPPIDILETPDAFLIAIEVPGVEPSAIELEAAGNVLTVKGVKEFGDPSEARVQVRERTHGSFHRQVALPDDVDFDRAEAASKNGVLNIRLPKLAAGRTRTIPVRPA